MNVRGVETGTRGNPHLISPQTPHPIPAPPAIWVYPIPKSDIPHGLWRVPAPDRQIHKYVSLISIVAITVGNLYLNRVKVVLLFSPKWNAVTISIS